MLHTECAMVTFSDRWVCEPCYYLEHSTIAIRDPELKRGLDEC